MSGHSNAAALILNGGRARRMGGVDKSSIEVEGRSIVQRQVQILRNRFDDIAMVGDAIELPKDLALQGIADRVGGQGPVDGIAAGLAWSPHPWLFVLASDMPYPSLPLLDALLEARREDCNLVCVLSGDRAQPLFALYHQRLLPLLDARLEEGLLRASDLVRKPISGVVVEPISESKARELDPKLLSFQNLNSPEDLLTSQKPFE